MFAEFSRKVKDSRIPPEGWLVYAMIILLIIGCIWGYRGC